MALVVITALGLAGYYLYPRDSTNQESPEDVNRKNALEIREAINYGFLRGTNSSRCNVVASEETRVIRSPTYNIGQVQQNAAKAWLYQKEKNDLIAKMTNGVAILINRGTIRPDTKKKPGLLALPTREGDWQSKFGDISNATFDIDSGLPADQMTSNWRDQYGDAGGAPKEGRPNVVLNALYTGNPWGPGGQLFRAVGNEYRDPDFADNRPSGEDLRDPVPAGVRFKNRVRFQ